MADFSKLIYKLFKSWGKPPVEFKVQTNDERLYHVIIIIDASKMDKNGPNYDKSYRKMFDYSGSGVFKTLSPSNVVFDYFSPYIREIEDGLELYKNSIQFGYNFENYSYLDNFEPLIDEAIKETAYPQVLYQFNADYSHPFLKLTFYNLSNVNRNEFFEQLSINLSGVIDLSSYNITYSSSDTVPSVNN